MSYVLSPEEQRIFRKALLKSVTVLRGGCCCVFDASDNVVEWCGAHAGMRDALKQIRDLSSLEILRANPYELTARLAQCHQAADAALADLGLPDAALGNSKGE